MPLNTNSMRDIGRLVRYHRKRAGLSRVELAVLAGTGKTVIYDIEHGKESVQFDSLRAILRALNIDMQFESPLMQDYTAGDQL